MEDKKSLKEKLKAHLPHKRERRRSRRERKILDLPSAWHDSSLKNVPGSNRYSLRAAFSAR